MNSDIKDHSNDAQQEAQGLEVVAWLNTSSSEATTYTPTVMDWDDEHEPVESLCRLSDATAVIDQLREQVEYTEGMYATAIEIVNELRADLETANSMLVATSKAGIQLRERVAELDEKVIQLEDSHARNLDWRRHCVELQAELSALKSAPVVMPEYQDAEDLFHPLMKDRAIGWNNCLDEVARLNRSKA